MAGDGVVVNPRKGRPDLKQKPHDVPWRMRGRVLAVWFASLAICTLILVMPLPFSGQVLVRVGEVATTDIAAPRNITYVSQVLTTERQNMAASQVAEVYDGVQARIGRQQLGVASQILDFISSVRSDTYADLATKVRYLGAITGVKLSAESINRILILPDAGWQRVADETLNVLESAMREEIRENTLADARRKVPSLIRLDLMDEDAAIAREIVQALLVPNSMYNAERTEERRQQARQRIEPVSVTIARNEIVLRSGTIVTPADIEALDALGLRQVSWSWTNMRAAVAFMLLLGLVFLYYIWRQAPSLWLGRTEALLLPGTVILFLLVARIAVPAHTVLPYIFPYASLAMLLAVVLGLDLALVTTGFFVLLVGWLTGGSLELMIYAFFGGLAGALKLRRGERLSSFAWAALTVSAVSLGTVLVFRLVAGESDVRGMAELAAAAVMNGLSTMTVTLLGIYLAGAFLGIATPLQLMEISRPTHPLLRQLLLKAPGTYHHTLIVSNMVERAAEAIGADAQLGRVGAYYHDVGKTIRPYFFIENRNEDLDPHARLDPYTSAQIIISHVKDGIDLARKYRLPPQVTNFIPEHHGTLLVHYFYHQAATLAGSPDLVDKAQFTYPGPRPQTLETGIAMLADGVEATVRAKHPATMDELAQIITESIQSRVAAGQLDECPLTLADLTEIKRAFFDVLRGIHHPRITYPGEPVAVRNASPLCGRRQPGSTAGTRTRRGSACALSHRPGLCLRWCFRRRLKRRLSRCPARHPRLRSLRACPRRLAYRWMNASTGEVDASDLARAIIAALVEEGRPEAEVTLVVGDDEEVRALNAQFLGEDRPTDVLSFPAGDEPAQDEGRGRAFRDGPGGVVLPWRYHYRFSLCPAPGVGVGSERKGGVALTGRSRRPSFVGLRSC